MKFLISPAKTLDYNTELPMQECSIPFFSNDTAKLNATLKKKSAKKLAALMDISSTLAEINYARNQERSEIYNFENARQAVFAFKGEVYLGLDAYSLKENQILELNQSLRILSGLYGLLKPLDLIQPYRLEMGTHLKIGKADNLYKFWNKKISQKLVEELQPDEPIINLASQEYFGAVNQKLISNPIITPVFKDFSNGEYKVLSFHAKKARGMMVRFAIDKNIKDPELLKTFDYGSYQYHDESSTSSQWNFIR